MNARLLRGLGIHVTCILHAHFFHSLQIHFMWISQYLQSSACIAVLKAWKFEKLPFISIDSHLNWSKNSELCFFSLIANRLQDDSKWRTFPFERRTNAVCVNQSERELIEFVAMSIRHHYHNYNHKVQRFKRFQMWGWYKPTRSHYTLMM